MIAMKSIWKVLKRDMVYNMTTAFNSENFVVARCVKGRRNPKIYNFIVKYLPLLARARAVLLMGML